MPARCRPLTPWGKEVKKRMLDLDMDPQDVVDAVQAKGLNLHKSFLSAMICGVSGKNVPETVAAIDEILGIPPDVMGRPA